MAVTLLVAAALIVIWLLIRDHPGLSIPARPTWPRGRGWLSGTAFQLSLTGVLLLGLAGVFQAIGWWNLTWLIPKFGGGPGTDPYATAELCIAVSMLALAGSVACHLVDRHLEPEV